MLLSLFWKHQPRSCISPVSSWSALARGAGTSVKSSSADGGKVCVDGARAHVHSQPFAMGKFLAPQDCPARCCSMSWGQSCHSSSSSSPCCQHKEPGRGETVPSACCSTDQIYSQGYSSREKEKYRTVRECSAGLELNNGNSQEWGLLVALHTQS